jgi:hypothetical protein
MVGGPTYRAHAKVFPGESSAFIANGGDAYGCRYPLGGTVVGTFNVFELRVKTLDPRGRDDGGAVRRLPSWGRRRGAPISVGVAPVSSVASFGHPCTFLFILDLLCKRISSSPCIGSAVWLYL